ncbi:MAG: DNA-3-methyladenine glycosylase [Patescibacteria group bacterium]
MIRAKKRQKIAAVFFNRPTLAVARDLLGKVLIRKIGKREMAVKITETEAYVGPRDRASHASRGRTNRTEPMFGAPGTVYVYLIYGMYHCLNIVTEKEGFPAAVLIRAAVPLDGGGNEKEAGSPAGQADGPGKLCRLLQIDKKFNKTSIFKNENIRLEDRGFKIPASRIGRGGRIGVEYAGIWAKKPWRFYLQ